MARETLAKRDRQPVEEMARLCRDGRHWYALAELVEDPAIDSMGYRRVLEARIVADWLAEPNIKNQIPRITDRFLRDFVSFDLSGSEGYLASLVDGRLSLEKVLLISTLGRFTTLLALARLREKSVLTLEA